MSQSLLYYLNRSENSLPYERWMEIPGYEMYYSVSNLGRVKSLDRYVPHPRHGSQFVKGRILSQKIIEHRNLITGIPSIDLQVALSLEGTMRFFNVRRLVYSAFKNRLLNFSSDGQYVINSNGDGLDCRLCNLKLVSKSTKSLRAYKRGRVGVSNLKTADRSKWLKPFGGASRRKPVTQYSLQGDEIVKEYDSVTRAAHETGFGEKEIIMVAKGRWKQYNGFKWKYLFT